LKRYWQYLPGNLEMELIPAFDIQVKVGNEEPYKLNDVHVYLILPDKFMPFAIK
jgi:hypothetical protein